MSNKGEVSLRTREETKRKGTRTSANTTTENVPKLHPEGWTPLLPTSNPLSSAFGLQTETRQTRSTARVTHRPLGPAHLELAYRDAHDHFSAIFNMELRLWGYAPKGRRICAIEPSGKSVEFEKEGEREEWERKKKGLLASLPSKEQLMQSEQLRQACDRLNDCDQALEEAIAEDARNSKMKNKATPRKRQKTSHPKDAAVEPVTRGLGPAMGSKKKLSMPPMPMPMPSRSTPQTQTIVSPPTQTTPPTSVADSGCTRGLQSQSIEGETQCLPFKWRRKRGTEGSSKSKPVPVDERSVNPSLKRKRN